MGVRILKRGRVPQLHLHRRRASGRPGKSRADWNEAARQRVQGDGWTQAARWACQFLADGEGLRSQPAYPDAPFSTLYLFGRGQDVGFQCAIDNSPRKRHHVRFWGCPLDRAEPPSTRRPSGSPRTRPSDGEQAMWMGASPRDIGLSLTRLSFQVTARDRRRHERGARLPDGRTRRHGVVSNVRSHTEGDRLAAGHVNRYVTDSVVAVADLAAVER